MPENLPAPSTGGWVAEWVTNGKLPGAAKAIAQLVGDTANAGSSWINIVTAKGEQIQQRIRTDTAGSKALMDALAAEAARQGVSDPALVSLAMQQFGSSTIRKHISKVAVMREAAEDLNSGEPTGEDTADIDDDWLNRFENLASDASSDRMRKLLGKVLAGEIRQPGAYSFATLNFINLLDANVGASISALGPYIVGNDYIPFINRFDFTPNYNHYMILKDYGVIGDSIRRKFPTPNNSSFLLRLKGYGILLKEVATPEAPIDLMPLTQIGREIFPLIDYSVGHHHLVDTVDEALKVVLCKSALIGPIILTDKHEERFVPTEERMREQHSPPMGQPANSDATTTATDPALTVIPPIIP